jgi:hypothetical protein
MMGEFMGWGYHGLMWLKHVKTIINYPFGNGLYMFIPPIEMVMTGGSTNTMGLDVDSRIDMKYMNRMRLMLNIPSYISRIGGFNNGCITAIDGDSRKDIMGI